MNLRNFRNTTKTAEAEDLWLLQELVSEKECQGGDQYKGIQKWWTAERSKTRQEIVKDIHDANRKIKSTTTLPGFKAVAKDPSGFTKEQFINSINYFGSEIISAKSSQDQFVRIARNYAAVLAIPFDEVIAEIHRRQKLLRKG